MTKTDLFSKVDVQTSILAAMSAMQKASFLLKDLPTLKITNFESVTRLSVISFNTASLYYNVKVVKRLSKLNHGTAPLFEVDKGQPHSGRLHLILGKSEH
jgi:hypothetical protein